MTSRLAGHFLVASPHLNDTNFYKAVVLLIRHDEEGAFGVVLNRPLESTVGEVWQALGNDDVSSSLPVYLGGPVTGPLIALHTTAAAAEEEVLPGVFSSTHGEMLTEIVVDNLEPFRIFSGYSGWGEGQLENELEEGSWLTAPATKEDVFGEVEELWKTIAARIGMEILVPRGKARHVPHDPELN